HRDLHSFPTRRSSDLLVAVVERGVTTHRASTYQSTLPTSGSKRYAPASPVVQWSVGPLTIPAQTMVDVRYQVEGTSEKALSTTRSEEHTSELQSRENL